MLLTLVGHVPRTISTLCSMFLLRGGRIEYEVIGARRYSRDLPQGGLELPCILTFIDISSKIEILKSLLDKAPVPTSSSEEPPSKCEDCKDLVPVDAPMFIGTWLSRYGYHLSLLDKEILNKGKMLNDMHINVTQASLKQQFPMIEGLRLYFASV